LQTAIPTCPGAGTIAAVIHQRREGEERMPDPQSILTNLRLIANDRIGGAVAWHVAVALCGLALALGWRPSRRLTGLLLSAPVASVGILAFMHGNPFNGAMFGAIAAVLAGIASRFGLDEAHGGTTVDRIAGAVMIAFAWLYPHFLDARPPATYLYAAPMGLIPCPTLALVIGFTLVSGGLASRAWSFTLAAAGLFYGLFGFFRLRVALDFFLVAGALALLVSRLRMPRARTEAASAPILISHSK
jgi:hypothetical protein